MSSDHPDWANCITAFIAGKDARAQDSYWGEVIQSYDHRLVYRGHTVATLSRGVALIEMPDRGMEEFHLFVLRSLRRRGVPFVVLPQPVRSRTQVVVHEVIDNVGSGNANIPDAVIRVRFGSGRKDYYMLTGWDHHERMFVPQNYFACVLPTTEVPTSVAHAKEMLKPLAVKIAEANGIRVKRQGDIFAIPIGRDRPEGYLRWGEYVLGTNHRVSQYVKDHDGNEYGKITMSHEPRNGRNRDHGPIDLGEQWHLLVKNTVPIAR